MKKCKVCGREYDSNKTGYEMCPKHYQQFKKYGKTLDSNPRTKNDPNEIIEYDDYAEVVLYNSECEECARTLIDLEDVNKVKQYKWSIMNKYVICQSKKMRLHRLIMDCPDDMIVDHINHDRFDNRKSNLRVCTRHQNNMNKSKQYNNTSGITGVYLYKPNNKWTAKIQINSRSINLGYFNTKEEAIEARKQAEIEYFGEYRNQEDEE